MRKKDEEVIKKVVDKIIDSKVLLTGDGDFYVTDFKGQIYEIVIRNLFSKESSIDVIKIHGSDRGFLSGEYQELLLFSKTERGALFYKGGSDLETSPSFKRLVEYIEENKHLILHNDKEYGKSHNLTDIDFI